MNMRKSCGLALAHAMPRQGNADVLMGYLGEGEYHGGGFTGIYHTVYGTEFK